jgi:hypothetical protein
MRSSSRCSEKEKRKPNDHRNWMAFINNLNAQKVDLVIILLSE